MLNLPVRNLGQYFLQRSRRLNDSQILEPQLEAYRLQIPLLVAADKTVRIGDGMSQLHENFPMLSSL